MDKEEFHSISSLARRSIGTYFLLIDKRKAFRSDERKPNAFTDLTIKIWQNLNTLAFQSLVNLRLTCTAEEVELAFTRPLIIEETMWTIQVSCPSRISTCWRSCPFPTKPILRNKREWSVKMKPMGSSLLFRMIFFKEESCLDPSQRSSQST